VIFLIAVFLLDACEVVADTARAGISGIVQVVGARSNYEFDLRRTLRKIDVMRPDLDCQGMIFAQRSHHLRMEACGQYQKGAIFG
jgi:hypothetical protein